MRSPALIRATGLCLLLGGSVAALASLFHPDDALPGGALQSVWVPVHLALTLAFLLVGLGVTGLYASQSREAGGAALAGFLLALPGLALTLADNTLEAGVVPTLAAQQGLARVADLLTPAGPWPVLAPLFLAGMALSLVGMALLGLATMRAGVLPQRAGLLLILGSLGQIVPVEWVHTLSLVVWGLALAWLGAGVYTRAGAVDYAA